MRFISFLTLAAPLVVYAAPVRFANKRDASANDLLVLKFANVLEQFESGFYQAGIAKFQDTDFEAAGFTSPTLIQQQLTVFQSDESTHATVLASVLQSFSSSPISGCSFSFDAALTDVPTMAATARIVEFVGVSAYLGGATLLDDPVLLDDAASILTVEARHSTMLNILSGTGSAVPSAFDIPLTPSEVLAVASPFISGCDVGIPANPTLSVTNTGTVTTGTSLTFSSSALNGSTDGFSCQMMVGGAPFAIVLPFDQCVVPSGINGPVAIWITSDGDPLANNVRDRATNTQIAGPTIAFIDIQPELIGQLARTSSSDESSVTTTISPAEASSIESSATATAAAGASSTSTPLGNSAAAPPVSSTPDLTTGPSADGTINVNGWTNLPDSSSSSSSSSGSSAAPPSSSTSVSSASTTSMSSSSTPAAVGNSASSESSVSSTPDLTTGPSPDGSINVNGWMNLPSSDGSSTSGSVSSSASPSSASSSASPSSSASAVGNSASSSSIAVDTSPDLTTGLSQDGSINVDGWTGLPSN